MQPWPRCRSSGRNAAGAAMLRKGRAVAATRGQNFRCSTLGKIASGDLCRLPASLYPADRTYPQGPDPDSGLDLGSSDNCRLPVSCSSQLFLLKTTRGRFASQGLFHMNHRTSTLHSCR
jgi:hypothetical protein